MSFPSDPGRVEALLTWAANILLLVTVQTTLLLAIAAPFRRQPATRHAALLIGLILLLFSPALAALLPGSNLGLLRLPIPTAASPESPASQSANTASAPAEHPAPVSPTPSLATTSPHPQHVVPLQPDVAVDAPPSPTTSTTINSTSPPTTSNVSAAPQAARSNRSLLRLLLLGLLVVWGAGIALLLSRLLWTCLRLAALLRRARRNDNATLAATFAELHGPRSAELVISTEVAGPVAAGWPAPRIVWPAHLVGRLTPDEIRNILVHELAHIRRRDQVIVLLQNLAAALLWVHPLTHLLNRALSRAREELCDNAVLTTTDTVSYSRTLLNLAQSIPPARPQPATVGFLDAPWRLEHRIAGLLDARRDRASRLSRRGRILVAAAALAAAGVSPFATLSRAATEPSPDTPTATRPTPSQNASGGAPMATPSSDQPSSPAAPKDPVPAPTTPPGGQAPDPGLPHATWEGRVTDANGRPVVASVAILGVLGGNRGSTRRVFAETTADSEGRFHLDIPTASPRTHRELQLVAWASGFAITWQAIAPQTSRMDCRLTLGPAEPLTIQFVNGQGNPTPNIPVTLTGIARTRKDEFPTRLDGLRSLETEPLLRNIPLQWTTDAEGRITIPIIPPDHGVFLRTGGTDGFFRHHLSINTGLSEERPPYDATYRGTVRNAARGETVRIPLMPATTIAGVVLLGETKKPAAGVRLTVMSSEQRSGSSIGYEARTDAEGRFRVTPYAGVQFAVYVDAPEGTGYFSGRFHQLDGGPGQQGQNLEIRLKAGRLIRGTVTDAQAGKPIAEATVQYHLQRGNRPTPEGEATGWPTMVPTDAEGRFQIVVGRGPGTLLVHAPVGSSYVLHERGSRELAHGTPGGTRTYAHAFLPIAPVTSLKPPEELPPPEPLAVQLEPAGSVEVRLIDPEGKPIERSIHTSRLDIHPLHSFWRCYGKEPEPGPVEIRGLVAGQPVPVWFLDPERGLGRVATVSLDDPRPTVQLQPCASARVRYLNPDGTPVKKGANLGIHLVVTPGVTRFTRGSELEADEDFSDNFDQETPRSSQTDAEGRVLYSHLVPGGTYRIRSFTKDEHPKVEREFVAEAGKVHDLGDIQFDTVP